MVKSPPPLTWLRAFEAAARHLSFTRAADELGFTQSAISQHVRALEDRLGTSLFIRANRTLQLTDAARLLLPDVASAMGLLDQATQRFTPSVTKPKLTITTSASIAQWVLAPHLAAFHAAHPELAVQLITTIWPDDFAAISADIEIRFGAPSVVGRDATLLTPSHLHLVAAPSLPLPDPVNLADLHDVPLIQPVGLATTWQSLSADHGLPHPLEPQYLVDTHGLAVDLAIGGAGVALTHCQISLDALANGQLRNLGIAPLDANEGYYMALRASERPQQQQVFANWLIAHLAKIWGGQHKAHFKMPKDQFVLAPIRPRVRGNDLSMETAALSPPCRRLFSPCWT